MIGYIASGIMISMSYPQLIKIIKDKHDDGVSLATWMLTVIAITFWFAHGIQVSSPPQIWGNIISIASIGAVVAVILRMRKNLSYITSTLLLIVYVTFSVYVLASFVSLDIVSAIAIIIAIASRMPQMFQSIKSARLGQSTSVSRITWGITIVGQSIWLYYGFITHDFAVILVNIVLLIVSGVIVIAESFANRKNHQENSNTVLNSDTLSTPKVV